MVNCNSGGEAERILALRRYDVLDTAPEEAFDRITRIAKSALGMPIALVSLLDEHRQWFKSKQGLDVAETSRDVSFCSYTIQDIRPMIVADTLADPRFANNPLVLGRPHIRFYVGVPLRSRDGYNIGSLCCLDSEPRTVTDTQIGILEDLAKIVVDELELRLLVSTDCLTGAMSRQAFHQQVERDMARAQRNGTALSCVLIDIDHFKAINDNYGHAAGDHVLERAVALWRMELRKSDYIGRLGGEEFAVMLPETPLSAALDIAERLRAVLAVNEFTVGGAALAVTASVGVAASQTASGGDDRLLHRADVAMYEAKAAGRNRVVSHAEPGMEPSAPYLSMLEASPLVP